MYRNDCNESVPKIGEFFREFLAIFAKIAIMLGLCRVKINKKNYYN